MKRYRPLVMIVEMVLGANIQYQSSIETNLKAMESNVIEQGYMVQSLTVHATQFLPQSRSRFYIVCVDIAKYASLHGFRNSVALAAAMRNLKSLWEDRLCCIKVPSDYALCMNDFLLPSDHPCVQAHLELVEKKGKATTRPSTTTTEKNNDVCQSRSP